MAAPFRNMRSQSGMSLIGVVVISSVVLILLTATMNYRNQVAKHTLRHRLKNDRHNIEHYILSQLDCNRTWTVENGRCRNHQFINLHTRNPQAAPFIGAAQRSWKKVFLKDKIGNKRTGYVIMRARCQPCASPNGCPRNWRMVVEYSLFNSGGEHLKDPFTNEPFEWKSVKPKDETFCRNLVWN